MEKDNQKESLIYEEMPNNLANIMDNCLEEFSESESKDIKEVFSKAKNRISEILYEHKYKDADIDRIVNDLFEIYSDKLSQITYTQRKDGQVQSSGIIKGMSRKEMGNLDEISDLEEKRYNVDRTLINIIGYSEDILNDENLDVRKKFEYRAQDLVLTELKNELKRNINPYDSLQAEEAFLEVSRDLSNRLVGDLEELHYENSRELNKYILQKFDSYMGDFKREYEELSKLNIDKDNENNKKLDLSNMVEDKNDVVKKDIQRQEEKSNKTIRQELEEMFK